MCNYNHSDGRSVGHTCVEMRCAWVSKRYTHTPHTAWQLRVWILSHKTVAAVGPLLAVIVVVACIRFFRVKVVFYEILRCCFCYLLQIFLCLFVCQLGLNSFLDIISSLAYLIVANSSHGSNQMNLRARRKFPMYLPDSSSSSRR